MNFIAAVLLYHCGEVNAFWLLSSLMEKYKLKDVLKQGMPGLRHHQEVLEKLVKKYLPHLWEHFDRNYVTISLFSTEWIISLFLNFLPIELTGTYLDSIFQDSWTALYKVAIEVLRFFEKKLLTMNDPAEIIGQIKQAKQGCEHLFCYSLMKS